VLRSHPFNDPEWVFEPKYDGFRDIAYLDRGSSLIFVADVQVTGKVNIPGSLPVTCDPINTTVSGARAMS
jgi:hypothetical protein